MSQLTQNEKKVIEKLHEKNYAKIISEQLGLSKSTIYYILKKLLIKKIVIKENGYNPARYYINPNVLKQLEKVSGGQSSSSPVDPTPSNFPSFCHHDSISSSFTGMFESSSGPCVLNNSSNNVIEDNSSPDPFIPPSDFDSFEGFSLENISPDIIRSHNAQFVIPINKFPDNLFRILQLESFIEIKQMYNWKYFSGNLASFGLDCLLQIKPHCVQIILKDIYSTNATEAEAIAIMRMEEIISWLEDRYQGLFLAKNRGDWKKGLIASPDWHHAHVHNALALLAKQRNIHYKDNRWELDSSKGMPELEAKGADADLRIMREIDDIKFRDNTGVTFKKLTENVHDYTTKNDQVLSQVDKNLEKTSAVLDKTVGQIGQISGGLLAYDQIIQNLTTNISNINNRFFEMSNTLLEKFNSLNTKIDIITNRMDQIEQKIDFLEQRPDPIITTPTPTNIVQEEIFENVITIPGPALDQLRQLKPCFRRVFAFIQQNQGLTRREIVRNSNMKRGTVSPAVTELMRLNVIFFGENKEIFVR